MQLLPITLDTGRAVYINPEHIITVNSELEDNVTRVTLTGSVDLYVKQSMKVFSESINRRVNLQD